MHWKLSLKPCASTLSSEQQSDDYSNGSEVSVGAWLYVIYS